MHVIIRPHSSHCTTQGQAMAEGVVMLLLLVLFVLGIRYIGHIGHLGLQQQTLSRFAAFQYSKTQQAPSQAQLQRQWTQSLPTALANTPLQTQTQTLAPLNSLAQPGQLDATLLRQEWGLADKGLGQVRLRTQAPALPMSWGTKTPSLTRHTAIVLENPAPHHDAAFHQQARRSQRAWGQAARTSASIARDVNRELQPLEGFQRPGLNTDWFMPWKDKLLRHHLR